MENQKVNGSRKYTFKTDWEFQNFEVGRKITELLAPKGFHKVDGTGQVATRRHLLLTEVQEVCKTVIDHIANNHLAKVATIKLCIKNKTQELEEVKSQLIKEKAKNFLTKDFNFIKMAEMKITFLEGELNSFENTIKILNK